MRSEIEYRIGTYYGEPGDLHTWTISDEQGLAAELYVSLDRHEIRNVEVRSDRRGEGLARALYEAAAAEMDIYHAPAPHRTPEGDAFARAVGGPTTTGACDCYGCTYEEE